MASPGKPPETRYIFRPWITLPDGTKIFARNYGKKAFRIPVKDEPKSGK